MTPEQAVEDWLRRLGEFSASEPAGGVPSGNRLTRPPFPPVLSSIETIKRRVIPSRQVLALSYRDTAGSPWFWVIRLIEADAAWRVCGGGGGNGNPQWDKPCVNLAGSWGEYGLALGGRVADPGAERAASARLRIGDTVVVDDVGHGVVLFVTSEPTARASAVVELLAQDESVLWRDELQLDD